jgi:hypothetical protein
MPAKTTIISLILHGAISSLSRVVQRVADAKRVRFVRNTKPSVGLYPISDAVLRESGTMKDFIWLADDFDAFDDGVEQLFDPTLSEASTDSV